MVCAVRLSRALLDAIDSLIRENIDHMNALSMPGVEGRVFFFIEYLFHTIALHRNMKVVVASQLSGIKWQRSWNIDEIEKDILYHPIKDKKAQIEFRERLLGRRSNLPQPGAEPLTRMDAQMTVLQIRSATDRGSELPQLVRRALEQAIAGETKLIPEILAMPGMSGRCYRRFINNLVGFLPASGYLEVGSWTGSTLCSAIFGNDVQAVAIDNWSEFGGPADQFFRHLAQFKGAARVSFLEEDFRRVRL